jgi:hypothetical protein
MAKEIEAGAPEFLDLHPTPEDDASYLEGFDAVVDPISTELDPEPEPTPAKVAAEPDPEPKNNPSRYEHWQSQAAKAQAKLDLYEPIVKLIETDPTVVAAIQAHLAGKNAPPAPPKIEKPSRPVRPADFDEVASVTDPESKSFKYSKELVGYQEQLADYLEKTEETRQNAYQAMEAQVVGERQRKASESAFKERLKAEGLKPDEVEDFMATMTGEQAVTVPNLVKLYQFNKGVQPKAGDPATQAKVDAMLARRKALDMPAPIGAMGGDPVEPVKATEQDMFNDSLSALAKSSHRPKKFSKLTS